MKKLLLVPFVLFASSGFALADGGCGGCGGHGGHITLPNIASISQASAYLKNSVVVQEATIDQTNVPRVANWGSIDQTTAFAKNSAVVQDANITQAPNF